MNATQKKEAADLASFIDASPSPSHACETVAQRLSAIGFTMLSEEQPWSTDPGRYYCVRGGSLIAWVAPEKLPKDAGFRLIGAHTDSPNLRIKPSPDRQTMGIDQLGVEVYGGVLLNSWLDRDLGVSGRVWIDVKGQPETRLFKVDRPLLRVPQLAIHLHRDIHTAGLKLNKQDHMMPIFSMQGGPGNWRNFLAKELGVDVQKVMHWDAMVHDLTPSTVGGLGDEFFFAPRLDNLASVWAGLRGLEEACEADGNLPVTPVLAAFDHEEVGSSSRSGAEGSFLKDIVERVVLARGGEGDDYHRAISQSFCVSSDMAHATHPNYPDKHDPQHTVRLNEGVVIKLNANQRYASEGDSVVRFEMACRLAGVPSQKWVMRSDLACGSTIGPITASGLGVSTVDVGGAMLSMHSAREMCGSHDPADMAASFAVVLAGKV